MANITPELASEALNLPPAEAIAFLESKGLVITWDWREQVALNSNKVFTVAKVMKMDVLKTIKKELEDSLKQGTTFETFKKNLTSTLQKLGWSGKTIEGKKIPPYRLKTIYRTNTTASLNAGRWKSFEDNKEDRPFLEYVAILDQSTRPRHRTLDDLILPIDSPRWNTIAPPNGYNCRCRLRALTKKQADKKKKPQNTAQKDFTPDKGFNTNPGKTDWRPKKSDYPDDIWNVAQPIKP